MSSHSLSLPITPSHSLKRKNMNLTEYKDVYVFAEQRNGKLQNVALELLGKARELADANNEKVVAMLLGKDVKALAPTLIEHGADRVMVVDHDLLWLSTTTC